jgi:sugar phosphate isomerase/epimerase
MVFGSPKQRSAVDDASPYDAVRILTEELAAAAPHAGSRGVKILLEPLSPDQTNVVTTLAEAAAIVKEIGSPSIQTMFDVHNAARETRPHSRLLREFAPVIHHVHVNERDGCEPGTGTYDFGELLSTLAEVNYSGWVSLEVFDFSRGPVEIARDALHYLVAALPSSALPQTI